MWYVDEELVWSSIFCQQLTTSTSWGKPNSRLSHGEQEGRGNEYCGESILQYNWPGIDQVKDRGTTMSETDYLYTERPYLLIM